MFYKFDLFRKRNLKSKSEVLTEGELIMKISDNHFGYKTDEDKLETIVEEQPEEEFSKEEIASSSNFKKYGIQADSFIFTTENSFY
jgi:hypothetical protein